MPQPEDYRRIWDEKPVLRAIYTGWYGRIVAACRPGRTLEIGGGSGNLKQFAPDVVSTDILSAAWLDTVCDAHRLPFAAASFDNIVLFDVLHHLQRPPIFLAEAARVLKPGGQLVMMEPGMTPVSRVFYANFHDEPVDMGADPYADGPLAADRDPYDANQAIPALLFQGRARQARFVRDIPAFAIRTVEPLALIAYPLSGGFRRWSLIPAALVPAINALENLLAPVLRRLLAFRLFVVLEKRAPS